MTTDRLINLLVADRTPVDRGRTSQALIIALMAGAVMAFGAMLLIFGPRRENLSAPYLHFELAKLFFTWAIVAGAAMFLGRLARPGGEVTRNFYAVISIPFVVAGLSAIAALAFTDRSTWDGTAVDSAWPTCLFAILLLAVGPFALVVWALRTGAPTNLATAGSAAGLVAGGLGAMACSLPCLDDSIPFIAAQYGMAIAICGALGARLGPPLLRW